MSRPTSPKSFKKRGFNPAKLIAVKLAKELGLPFEETLFSKDGKSQKEVEGSETRIMNVRDKFFTLPNVNIARRRILLLDDVRTTGATLLQCKEQLLLADAAEVLVIAFAAD